MKTISFKADDVFVEKLNELSIENHVSKSELIRISITAYEKLLRREQLKAKIMSASNKVRQVNKSIPEDLDGTAHDGLENV